MNFEEHIYSCLTKSEADLLLKSLSLKDKHAVLLNTNKITSEEFLKEFPNVKPHPVVKNAFLYDKEEYPLGKHLYHELGYYYLQEPSAMVTSSLLDYVDGDIVLDLCAAPGGKSVQASLFLANKGVIISNDISATRAALISNNAERLGLSNLLICSNDFSKIYSHYLNFFDKIILDAPCSGSGMFRKDSNVKEDWSINKVNKFSEVQKELIQISYKMLKEGGSLVYSTCSYSIEEDEDVIEYLLDNTDAELVKLDIKGGYVNELKPLGVRLMPSHFPGEGQYICLIKKPGIEKPSKIKNDKRYKNIVTTRYKDFDIRKYGNFYFALPINIDTKYLNVIRYGVKVCEENKGVIKYDLHYARNVNNNDDFYSVNLSLDEVKKYIEGNPVNKQAKKGNVLLTYNSNSIDITKSDSQVIKNHYPKGLRRKY